MTRLGRFLGAALFSTILFPWTTANAQGDCLNETMFPGEPTTANALGQVTIIATNSYQEEYSQITGVLSGANYEFTMGIEGYITLREGTYDGAVVAQGAGGSLQYLTTSTLDLFAHWSADDQCGTAAVGMETTVQLLLDCTPATVSYTFTEDCPTEAYFVQLNIEDIGDAASLDVSVDVNGDITTTEDVGVGNIELGPFYAGDNPIVTVAHDTDPLCNIVLGPLVVESNCPNLITCGAPPEEQTYCYEPDDSRHWLYTSVGTGTLRLRFLRGTIESNNYDSLRIYDGVDNTAPLLFNHDTLSNYNLGPQGSAINNTYPRYYALDLFATGNSIYMEMGSDGSAQCGGEFPSELYDAWEWEVSCLDCELPVASYSVVDDCPNDQFSIPIEIASTGDGAVVNIIYIVNGGDPQTVINVGVGTAELGPFALNDTVNVVVQHASSALCNIELGDITDTGACPLLIDCGTEVTETVCYNNSQDLRYYYQGTGTYPLGVFFDSGLLFFGDSLYIYDGGSIDADLLFAGTDENVTDLFVNTTNPDHLVTIRIISNEFTSCVDGFEPEQLAWRVACLDCVPAATEFNIVQDCDNFQYFIDVVISDLGTDAEAQIATTATQDTLTVTAPGTYQIGPFVSGTELEVTIVNDANSLCNVYSGLLVNPLCPVLIDCPGPTLEETYCYEPNDFKAWAYELVGATGSLRLTFTRGSIESATYDDLRIYDGADNTGTLLFEHNNTQAYNLGEVGSGINNDFMPYYTVDVGSTTGLIYMEMSSDGSGQCGGEFPNTDYDGWEWQVYCIDCTTPQATVNVISDCVHREYSAEVIVTEVGDDAGLTITNLIDGESIADAAVGVYTFGPYDVDSVSRFRVFNQEFVQCKYTSDTLTYTAEECISVTCGFDNYSYCYENDEDRFYVYQSAQNVPMTIGFLQGQMLAGDRITLYNGRDENAPVLYDGNNGGNLVGFAINSANVDNFITLRIRTDASGSCEDGAVTNQLEWTVACGAVGFAELADGGFAVYPNPTQGVLQIELGAQVSGAVQLRILDMSGRVVMDQPLLMNGGTRNTVDMRGLQSGNYMVQLTTNTWIKTQRVQLAR